MSKPETTTGAKGLAPPHRENDPRYSIAGADYRNVFGELLWSERPYLFSRLSGKGEQFAKDGVWYRVHRVAIADGIIHYNIVAA